MLKSKKTRCLAAATLLTGSAACVSAPQRKPPEPAECPAGSVEAQARFGMYTWHGGVFPPYDKFGIIEVREGDIALENLGDWGTLPSRSLFFGRIYFANNRVYGRFTKASLPSGETIPVCLEMVRNADLGVPMEPGSTPEKARIPSSVSLNVTYRFN